MPLTNDDLQSIVKLVNNGSNLVLGELNRVQQKIYDRFDKTDQALKADREEVNIIRYSNETIELSRGYLCKKDYRI